MSTSNGQVTIGSYGQYSGSNYGVHAMHVHVGEMDLYFSYKTCVAFRGPGFSDMLRVRENEWGPTTGKHLNMLDGGATGDKKDRLDSATFETALADMLARCGLSKIPASMA